MKEGMEQKKVLNFDLLGRVTHQGPTPKLRERQRKEGRHDSYSKENEKKRHIWKIRLCGQDR